MIKTPLFFRDGRPFEGTPRTNKSGAAYTLVPRKCGRCGGAGGADAWKHTGWTCYDCGGSGKHKNGPAVVKLYTAEKLAKLNLAKSKADARKAAKAAERKAKADAEIAARREAFMTENAAFLADARRYAPENDFVRDVLGTIMTNARITDGQRDGINKAIARIKAHQAAVEASQWQGAIGERLTVEVTVTRVGEFSRPIFGAFPSWGGHVPHETVSIYSMTDAAGNVFVVKSPNSLKNSDRKNPCSYRPQPGDKLTLVGTVKKHDSYRDIKQTVLNRPVVKAFVEAPAA